MQKLSKKSQQYLQKILKYYPMETKIQKQNKTSQQNHKYPQQHLHDYRKERQIYDRPTSQKLDSIRMFKEQGNNHYKNGRFQEATYFYQKAIIYGDYTFPQDENSSGIMDQLLQQANCNLALTFIKVNEWESAKTNLIQASKGNNLKVKAKALFWLTKYYIKVSQFDKALETINKISNLDPPHNISSEQLSKQLKQFQSSNTQRQKRAFTTMFQK